MIFKQKDEYFCRIKPKQDIVQTVTNFLLLSAENATKNSKGKIVTSDIFKTITMRVNLTTRQMTPFFSYIP